MTGARRRILIFSMAAACALACFSLTTAAERARGERTRPLETAAGSAFHLRAGPPPLVRAALPPAISGSALYDSGIVYALHGERLVAIELISGRKRWSREVGLAPFGLALSTKTIFVARQGGAGMLVLSKEKGDPVAAIDGMPSGTLINGVLYGRHGQFFAAYNADALSRIWQAPLDPHYSPPGDRAVLWGNTLFEVFWQDGGQLVPTLLAFDARTGHVRWAHGNGQPLGFAPGVVYVDSTFGPLTGSEVTVDAIKEDTGEILHSYTYTPRPSRIAAPVPPNHFGDEDHHRVSGGFLYLTMGSWYRYDADRPPAQAHPVQLVGIDAIRASFSNGTLLVDTPGGAALAESKPDRIVLHDLGLGPIQSNVVARADGEQYAVIGKTLTAFDSMGRPRAVGSVACAHLVNIWPSSTRVVVVHVSVCYRPS